MKHNVILFDLDGTLTDPGEGITNSVAYALRKLGQTPPPRAELEAYIGPPLAGSFEQRAGLDRNTAQLAVEYYREYFGIKGIFENELYGGIDGMLAALKAAGATISLATSKPTVYAKQIIEHFGIAKYFDAIAGSELDGRRVKKAEVIDYALELLGVSDRDSVIMVGDREHDIIGANKCGVASVGVTYGYGSHEELANSDAGHIIDSVDELAKYLIN